MNLSIFCVLLLLLPGYHANKQQTCDSTKNNCQTTENMYSDNGESSSWFSNAFDTVKTKINSVIESLVKTPRNPYADMGVIDGNVMSTDEFMEDVMKHARSYAEQFKDIPGVDTELLNEMFELGTDVKDEIHVDDVEDEYEYPPLTRRSPGTVGDVNEVELDNGHVTKIITRAINPPIFEVPDFISKDDCDYIIAKSNEQGMKASRVFSNTNTSNEGSNIKPSVRRSESSHLNATFLGDEFYTRLTEKVSKLIDMPFEVVDWSSKGITIGKYEAGGYYHAHLDSVEGLKKTECCFQKKCENEKGEDIESVDCCRFCRYVTVLYYLNDVEEGGETAFPIADRKIVDVKEGNWGNLTESCHNASVVIKPEKGKAIMWYNNFVDSHGYLGGVDRKTFHGGCNIIKGTKWIATSWITTPIYKHRFVPSKFRDHKND